MATNSGKITQPDRTTGYNRMYWGAVTKDINRQMSRMNFPSRPSSGRPLPTNQPYRSWQQGYKGPVNFGNKKILPGD